MKKAVIFDLDGTLNDTIDSIKISADAAAATVGIGPFSEDEYKYFVGDGAAVLIERVLEAGGDSEHVHFDAVYAEYQRIFEKYCMYNVRPYDGIPELLDALKEKGVQMAVLSNKPHVRTLEVIHDIFGDDYFAVVQGQQEGIERKPSPEGVFHILNKLSLTADDILYVGDTGTDMQTGKSAGAFSIGAFWGFREENELRENGADVIVGHPLEVLNYL